MLLMVRLVVDGIQCLRLAEDVGLFVVVDVEGTVAESEGVDLVFEYLREGEEGVTWSY